MSRGLGDVYKRQVVITDQVTYAQADGVDTITSGTVTINSFTDTYDNFIIAHDTDAGKAMGGADVLLTGTVTLAQLNTVNADTTGAITFSAVRDNRTNITAINASGDYDLSSANVTVSDQVTLTQADTLDAMTDGTLTVESFTGTLSNFNEAHGDAGKTMTGDFVGITSQGA